MTYSDIVKVVPARVRGKIPRLHIQPRPGLVLVEPTRAMTVIFGETTLKISKTKNKKK
jgi:hypothetical protein